MYSHCIAKEKNRYITLLLIGDYLSLIGLLQGLFFLLLYIFFKFSIMNMYCFFNKKKRSLSVEKDQNPKLCQCFQQLSVIYENGKPLADLKMEYLHKDSEVQELETTPRGAVSPRLRAKEQPPTRRKRSVSAQLSSYLPPVISHPVNYSRACIFIF